MARINPRYLLDGGAEGVPTKTKTPITPFIDPQDVRDPVTGLTPAQVAAQQALSQAVTAGAALGIKTTPNVATAGNVPTVTITNRPTGPTGPTGPGTKTKKEVGRETLGSGLSRVIRVYYDDGTFEDFPSAETPSSATAALSAEAQAALLAKQAADAAAEEKRRRGQSAYNLLFEQFNQYGLGGLIAPLQEFITEGLSPAEFTIRLRETDAYKKRFAANAQRMAKGLRALSEAEYITLEDQYQNVMRNYGLPASYYARGDMGRQQGFEKFIAGDVSAAELEDRIQTAQNRVINAAPQVGEALRQFYPDISNGDILAYALDPEQALTNIKRKVSAAEIGAGALQAGLATGLARAEELQRYGVTGEAARTGYGVIASGLERGRQLSGIYQQPEYTQQIAETEVFQLPTAEEARRQRTRLGKLEEATFGGTTGMTGGALARDRAGAF